MELKSSPYIFLTTVFSFSVLLGCDKRQEISYAKTTYIDDLGYPVEINKTPQRIISLAPNLTEIIFAVRADSQMVGITDYCNFPAGVSNKSKVGGIINPNLEAIIALKPDLVFATADGNPKPTVEKLKAVGIPVYVFNVNRYSDVLGCIRMVGKLTGHSIAADSVVTGMTASTAHLKPLPNKPGVFFVLNRNPIISASGGSFLNDILEIAGGRNVVGKMNERYPTLNRESVIQLNPDYFIIPEKDFQPLPENEYTDFNSLSSVPAVKEKRVYYMNPDIILRPGPRLVLGIQQLNFILSQ